MTLSQHEPCALDCGTVFFPPVEREIDIILTCGDVTSYAGQDLHKIGFNKTETASRKCMYYTDKLIVCTARCFID